MKKLWMTFTEKNVICGYLYFYIHFVTEILCFYFLMKVTNGSNFVWLIPFFYDGMAFVPQAIIGRISDKYPKIDFSIIGMFLMVVAYLFQFLLHVPVYIALFLLCIGNGCVHINGAEVTLKASNGKLSHSAIFVAGGSFGVITGRLLASSFLPYWAIMILAFTTIPYIILAKRYVTDSGNCDSFDYAKKTINPGIVVILAVFVVIIRGYMGYGIPTSWNKTVFQNIMFFCIMGFGKAARRDTFRLDWYKKSVIFKYYTCDTILVYRR